MTLLFEDGTNVDQDVPARGDEPVQRRRGRGISAGGRAPFRRHRREPGRQPGPDRRRARDVLERRWGDVGRGHQCARDPAPVGSDVTASSSCRRRP